MLLSFSEQRVRASIQELAAEVSVPVSTAYRYVSLLKEMGLLEEGPRNVYHVAPRVLSLSRAMSAANTLSDIALPVMRRLAAEVDETVMLVRVIAGAAVCVEHVESSHPVRLSVRPGQPLPLYAGASGKSLLAHLPEEQRENVLLARAQSDPAFADRLPAFRRELVKIAERGWTSSHAEIDEGIWACSAAIRHPEGAAATLSTAGPAYRIDEARQAWITERLLPAAAELARQVAHYAPSRP